jgi:hypothetical protein
LKEEPLPPIKHLGKNIKLGLIKLLYRITNFKKYKGLRNLLVTPGDTINKYQQSGTGKKSLVFFQK